MMRSTGSNIAWCNSSTLLFDTHSAVTTIWIDLGNISPTIRFKEILMRADLVIFVKLYVLKILTYISSWCLQMTDYLLLHGTSCICTMSVLSPTHHIYGFAHLAHVNYINLTICGLTLWLASFVPNTTSVLHFFVAAARCCSSISRNTSIDIPTVKWMLYLPSVAF